MKLGSVSSFYFIILVIFVRFCWACKIQSVFPFVLLYYFGLEAFSLGTVVENLKSTCPGSFRGTTFAENFLPG